jgi:hypothetical protein
MTCTPYEVHANEMHAREVHAHEPRVLQIPHGVLWSICRDLKIRVFALVAEWSLLIARRTRAHLGQRTDWASRYPQYWTVCLIAKSSSQGWSTSRTLSTLHIDYMI